MRTRTYSLAGMLALVVSGIGLMNACSTDPDSEDSESAGGTNSGGVAGQSGGRSNTGGAILTGGASVKTGIAGGGANATAGATSLPTAAGTSAISPGGSGGAMITATGGSTVVLGGSGGVSTMATGGNTGSATGGQGGALVGSGGTAATGLAAGAAGEAGNAGMAGSAMSAAAGTAGSGPAACSLVNITNCTGSLANIGTADFRIQFSIVATQTALTAVVSQRSTCSHGVFWSVRMSQAGEIVVETDDAAHYTSIHGGKVNDGGVHLVRIERVGGTLKVYVDCVEVASDSSLASFGPLLATAQTGTDVCVGADGTNVLTGTVADVCIASN